MKLHPQTLQIVSRAAPSTRAGACSSPRPCLLPLAAARGRRRHPCRPHLSVRAGPAPRLLLNAGARPSRLLAARLSRRGWGGRLVSVQRERLFLLVPGQHDQVRYFCKLGAPSACRWLIFSSRGAGLACMLVSYCARTALIHVYPRGVQPTLRTWCLLVRTGETLRSQSKSARRAGARTRPDRRPVPGAPRRRIGQA